MLDDVTDPARCFADLYDHFARPTSWACVPGVGSLLAELRRRPLKTAIASNFDHRLLPIAAGLPELAVLDGVFVSSAVGWRKPAPGFFEAVVRGLGVRPDEVLFVGDDPTNDFRGASRGGNAGDPLRSEDWTTSVKQYGRLQDLSGPTTFP